MKIFDIHSHVIPKVDDGSDSIEMSMKMLLRAKRQGVTDLILTSHSSAFDISSDTVYNNYNILKRNAEDAEIDINLYIGCEIFIIPQNINDVIKKLNNKTYPTMNNTRYILIEFDPYSITWEEIKKCCQRFIDNDYYPIIAHAEKYIFNDIKDVYEIKRIGAKIQCNAYSVAQDMDIKIRLRTEKLLEDELVDYIGSDAHRTNHRNFEVEFGANYITEKYDKEYADKILYDDAFESFIEKEI